MSAVKSAGIEGQGLNIVSQYVSSGKLVLYGPLAYIWHIYIFIQKIELKTTKTRKIIIERQWISKNIISSDTHSEPAS